MSIFGLSMWIQLLLILAMFLTTAFAVVDAATHRPDAYVAADKLTKKAWLIILGLALAAQMLLWRQGPLSLFHLAGIVAALVYLVDVRPALRALTRR